MQEESGLFGAEDSISGYSLVDARRNTEPARRTSLVGARVCAVFRLASRPEMPTLLPLGASQSTDMLGFVPTLHPLEYAQTKA